MDGILRQGKLVGRWGPKHSPSQTWRDNCHFAVQLDPLPLWPSVVACAAAEPYGLLYGGLRRAIASGSLISQLLGRNKHRCAPEECFPEVR